MTEFEDIEDTKPEFLTMKQKFLNPDLITQESSANTYAMDNDNQSCNDISGPEKVSTLELIKEEWLYKDPLLVPTLSSLDESLNKRLTKESYLEKAEQKISDEDSSDNDKTKSLSQLLPLAASYLGNLNTESAIPSTTGTYNKKISDSESNLILLQKEYQLKGNDSFGLKDKKSWDEENNFTEEHKLKEIHECLPTDNERQIVDPRSKVATDDAKIFFDLSSRKRGRGRPRVLFKKTHPCSICNKVFSRKTHLTTHLRIHSDEKPFSCNLCEKRFRDNSVLIKHVRVHTQDKPYACTVCGKAFNQKGNMERHGRQHTNEKPFICSVCQNAFSNKSHLQRHFRIHANEKPFTCELCDKSFRQKSHLMRHVLVHSREKPYSCNFCGKKFRQEQHVTRHKKTHIKAMITNVLLKNCITKSINPRYLNSE